MISRVVKALPEYRGARQVASPVFRKMRSEIRSFSNIVPLHGSAIKKLSALDLPQVQAAVTEAVFTNNFDLSEITYRSLAAFFASPVARKLDLKHLIGLSQAVVGLESRYVSIPVVTSSEYRFDTSNRLDLFAAGKWWKVDAFSKAIKFAEVGYKRGMHIRPTYLLAELASEFKSDITLTTVARKRQIDIKRSIWVMRHGREVSTADIKDFPSLLGLGAIFGTRIKIEAMGPDAEYAAGEIAKFIKNGDGD